MPTKRSQPSTSVEGMLTADDLRRHVAAGQIDTVIAAMPDMYGRLMGKRLTARHFVADVLGHGTHGCNYLLASDMEMDPIPGYAYASWIKGYGDFHMVPNLGTLRACSWLDKTALVLCDVLNEDHTPVRVAPRTILADQMARAAARGYLPMGASELEFYIFDDSYEEAARKGYTGLSTSGNYAEDYHILHGARHEQLVGAMRKHLEKSGIPVESSKGEWSPGQHEINVTYSDLLTMADNHVVYKHLTKEVAIQQGRAITYMAKWDERSAGSSCHIHASLWDKAGKRALFKGNHEYGPTRGSDEYRWFLGGWMAHLRELTAFYAPYPTSYKRYVAGGFAPTRIACSYDNRTVGFRVVGSGSSLRIECRVPGADTNPYLAFAASIAAGLDGIANKMEPPAIFNGDAYTATHLPLAPTSLNEAIDEMARSTWLVEAFGADVIGHYLHFFRTEQRKFDEVVTSWERARYFERA